MKLKKIEWRDMGNSTIYGFIGRIKVAMIYHYYSGIYGAQIPFSSSDSNHGTLNGAKNKCRILLKRYIARAEFNVKHLTEN